MANPRDAAYLSRGGRDRTAWPPELRHAETCAWRFGANAECDCGLAAENKREWHCVTPNGHGGNLAAHDVTEHEDGTITVSPSILVTQRREGQDIELWHGYLERGVWRSV